jgi:tetratricopeptide (TPR) repeat protein
MSSRIPLAPGTMVGRYVILGLAGEGGMGDIYKAMDTSLERTVALKRVRSGIPGDATQERFRREALALAQLNHPGICQVFELSETDRGTFIAMEWVEGRTLAEVLHPDPLPWRQAAALLREVADALAAAHAKGLVHRDLKPSNIMVTPEGHAKVLDFGLVRFAGSADEPPSTVILPEPLPEDAETAPGEPRPGGPLSGSGSGRSLTRIGSFMGTLGYTSPEQALARPVGPPSDIFSLGILAHEMVAGERPFPGEGRAALDSVVDNQRDPLNRSHGSKAYRALVDRMLASKPKDRPTAEETATGFARMLKPLSALAWSGLSAAAVALLVLSGYWLFGRGVLAGLVKGRPARVAVMGFRNGTGQPILTAQTELGLASLVAASLRHSPKLQVLDSDALAQAALALKLSPATATPEDQRRLAKALGADLVLSGEVTRRDGKDQLSYMLLDTNGRTRAEGSIQSASISDVSLAATQLSEGTSLRLKRAVDPFSAEAGSGSYAIPAEAFANYAQGVEAYRHSHFLEAEPLLAKAAYAAPEWSSAVVVYAEDLIRLSRPGTDATLQWALVAARKESNGQLESAVYQSLGQQAFLKREFKISAAYYKQGLAMAEAHSDLFSSAFCLNGLGLAAASESDMAGARRQYAEALDKAKQAGDLFMEAQILANLGNLALEQGDLPEAAKQYRATVDAAKAAGDESGEALGLNNLGITLLSNFQVNEAHAALERSLALRLKNGETRKIVSGYRNLGICAQMEGREEDARTSFKVSLEKAEEIQDAYGAAQARFYLAELDRRAGKLPQAMLQYRQASLGSEASYDRTRLGQELAGQAECDLRQHRERSALPALERAESLIPGNPYLLRAQAWAAFLKRDRSRAMECLEEALRDPRHDAPEIRMELLRLRSYFQSRVPVP